MGQLYVLDGSHRRFVDIPTPYNSQANDSYAILELGNTSYPILSDGGTAIIRENEIASGYLHVIQSSIGAIIVRLTVLPNDLIKVDSFCPDFPSHTAHIDKLNVVGAVCEVYPKGFDGARWILWEPAMGKHCPKAIASAALKATSSLLLGILFLV